MMKGFKEFVPGMGLVTPHKDSSPVTSSSSADMSPAVSKFLNRNPEDIPYWSPASKSSANVATSTATISSELTPSANEFVPSTLKMSTSAAEFHPYKADDWSPEAPVATQDAYYDSAEAQPEVLDTPIVPALPRQTLQAIGIPEPARQAFAAMDIEASKILDPNDERHHDICHRYYCAYPLDDPSIPRGAGGSYGYPTAIYKVIDKSDSQLYALRRVDNARTSPAIIKNVLAKWLPIRHSNIVSLHQIILEKNVLFFAHAYHAGAQTLRQRFIDNRSNAAISEALLWRLIVQITSALRFVHSRNLALRSLSVNHVLLTFGGKFRVNNGGLVDVLEFQSRKTLVELQAEDLVKLGYLVLSVATKSFVGPRVAQAAVNMLSQRYSNELTQVVTLCITSKINLEQLSQIIYQKAYDELDNSNSACDALQSNLRNEYENSRMFRLMLKLGLVNERPDSTFAPHWSETGDRYILKLFRDYVFHQIDATGAPSLDMGHIVLSLNKLDMGSMEQILLSSRDGKDMFVVTFNDIRRCSAYAAYGIYLL